MSAVETKSNYAIIYLRFLFQGREIGRNYADVPRKLIVFTKIWAKNILKYTNKLVFNMKHKKNLITQIKAL